MVNPDWTRWIKTSIYAHFDSAKQDIPLIIEAQGTPTQFQNDRAELRINGPFFNCPQGNHYFIDVNVNLLLTVAIDDNDAYKMDRVQAIFLQAYSDIIYIYKYGDGTNDDQSLLACMIMRRNYGDDIIISNFGQINPDIRIYQSALDAIYKTDIDGI